MTWLGVDSKGKWSFINSQHFLNSIYTLFYWILSFIFIIFCSLKNFIKSFTLHRKNFRAISEILICSGYDHTVYCWDQNKSNNL